MIANSFPTVNALRRTGRAFLNWWVRELAAAIPSRIRHWWRGASYIALLTLDDSHITISQPTENGIKEILSISLVNDGHQMLTADVRGRLAKAVGKAPLLLATVQENQVLEKKLLLPTVLLENLRQTLAFELDRYTPFRPDQAYFDYRLTAPLTSTGQVQVELAVVSRAIVDQYMVKLTALGFSIHGVVLKDDFKNLDDRYRNLLPVATSRDTKVSGRSKLRIAFGMLSIVLVTALLAIPAWQKRSAAIALIGPVAEAKIVAQETDAFRDRLETLVEEHNFLPNKKWDSHSTARMLDELTRLLPDDTFVIQLDFTGKAVQIVGETASSANLVESIEGSPFFKDVAFISSLTKIQGSAYDRFQIGATLEGAKRPAPSQTSGAKESPLVSASTVITQPTLKPADKESTGVR